MSTTLTSVLPPLFTALADVINADSVLSGLLQGGQVYSLTAPRDAAPPYIVLGDTSAAGFSVMHQAGEASAVTLHLWSGRDDQAQLLLIYAALFRVLHLKPLPIAGHAHCTGALELIITMLDPSGELSHAVAKYRTQSLPI